MKGDVTSSSSSSSMKAYLTGFNHTTLFQMEISQKLLDGVMTHCLLLAVLYGCQARGWAYLVNAGENLKGATVLMNE